MGLPSTIFPELAQEPDKAPEPPITEDILDRVRRVESGGGKYLVSPKGALGPYQIMPATAAEYGIDPMQEPDARETARRILEKNYIKYGDLNLALMAYHAGQGNVDRYLAGGESRVGPLTLSYPEKVMGAPVAASSLSTKLDDKTISPELQQDPIDKFFSDLIPAPGAFSAEVAPEKKAPQKGAFMRGLETEWEQTKALAPGLVGLVGATGEAAFGEGGTWSDLKNWGLTGYQTRMKSIEEKAAETDDVLKAWERAKQGDLGALLEWGKFGLGYLAGNIGEAVITGGVGSLVGKAAFKSAGEGILRGMVAKEAAKLAEKEAAGTGVALGAKELAERAAAPELIEAATRNVAGRVGSIAALAGTNIAKETGSIYGEAEEEAAKKGEKLDGADLARIWGSGLVAGLSEAAVDRLGLDIAGGRLKIPGTGRAGSAMVGGALGAGIEGSQEFLQTAIERYGAAKELSGDDAYRDYINSVALGALGGGTVGGVIGAFRGKKISREEAEAALKAAQEELNAKAKEAGKVLGTDAETVRAANDILLALPPPEKGKYGPDYGFTRRGEREGEGVDIVRTPEERIEEFRRQQKAEAEAPVETPAEPRRIGFEPFDEEGALRGKGFTMRGAEEDVAPIPQEEFKPAGLIETRIRDVEPLPPREVAEIRLSELSDGDRVTKAWLSEQTGEKGKSLDSLWMDLIGDKFLRREGNKFVRNAPEEQPEAPRAQATEPAPKPVEPEPAPELVETDIVAEPAAVPEPAAKETLLGPLGKKPPTPRNILDWIADTGGIWDAGGELKAMDLHLYKKPGQKKLIVGFGDPRQIDIDPLARKAVRDLDKVTSEAIEAKYLPEEAGPNDLLEAMRATRAGRPVYSSLDYNDAQALQEWNDLKADKEKERNKIEQDASLYGIKTEGKSLSTLLKEIAEAEAKVSKKERQYLAGPPRKAIDAARALDEEYIPFDEEDIPFSRDAGRRIAETKFSRGAGIYYSTLEEATQKLPPSGTGQQMLASLQNIPGVKPNEIVATGLDTWLPEQGRVTRDQVQEYVAQNAVEVREVTKQEVKGRKIPPLTIEERENDYVARDARGLEWGTVGKGTVGSLAEAETYLNRYIYERERDRDRESRSENAPKFNRPDTTLPGGENYREVLLTLPKKKFDEGDIELSGPAQFGGDGIANWGGGRRVEGVVERTFTLGTESGRITFWPRTYNWNGAEAPRKWVVNSPNFQNAHFDTFEAAIAGILAGANSTASGYGFGQETFRGGHFSEPNVLAHVRLNDRTDADGKRVLFVEEIQSDWHQKGRKQGYDAAYYKVRNLDSGNSSDAFNTKAEAEAFLGRMPASIRPRLRVEQGKRSTGVPDAPFKKDWHELAFRRVLKMAADEGYDRVAWTTGDQQNDRYDLSRQVDSIRVWSNGEGLYYWEARKDGRDLGRDGGKAIDESALADVIGKDLAKRAVDDIAAGKDANYSGIDLKVGGAGMRGFYDKMLPAYANKFGKKYGAKVGDTVITTPKPEKVHSINITPQMRDALREGIPLFSRSDRDADNPPTPSKLLRQEKISDTLITEDFENPQTREEQKVRVSRAMKDALAHVLGPGVDVRVVDQVLGKWDGQWNPVGGAFDPVEKVIALSMESPNIERTAFHEAIHFLREANVISDADWKLLSEQADKWKDKAYKSTWEKYADKKNETRTEEVIADAYSDWRNGRLDVPNPILRIFHKILDFVQRLKKKIGYEGARSWKDVFTDIESGRYRDLAGQYHLTEMARDGSFALVDSRTARAVGNYQTKKAAITAALDIEAAQNASLRLQRESAIAVDDAATKVAAKHSVDQMIGIAQRKAMFSRMPSLESEATYLTNWWGKAILPVAMAAKDRIFARVWNVVNDRERFTSRIYQDYFSPLRGLSNLSAQEKTNVYKAAVAARMDGVDVKPSKSNVTIKYKGADDIIDHTANKVWLKSGETISLNSKETESFFALKNAFKNVWADLNDAAAIKAGFPMDGNIKELRDAAMRDGPERAAFLQKYKNIPGIDKILKSMTAGIYQERAGYIPFQRYGSVIIAVTRKGAKKGDAPLATVLVDADSADMPSVKKARKALEDRYGAVGDVQEPRLVSENDYSGAAMEEMEHLISRLERAAGRDKGDLYKAYIEKVADEFKRGWQRKSRNVLGFSTDFEKVIPEYLSNAAQTNGRMRYANAIDRQMREINNPRGGTPADGVPSKSVRDFTNKWLNYVDNPSNDFSTTRKVGFLWYLWGNLSSAVVNLSQTPLVTLPVVAKWGMNLGQSTAEATKIANLFFSRKAWYMQDGRILLDIDKMNFLSDAEKRAVKGWQQSGLLQNQITNDQAGLGYVEKISNKAIMRNIEKVFQAGASTFALAETANRLTAGLIAYRSALKTDALGKAIKVYEKNQAFQDRFDGGRTLTPEKMAAWTIEETQFFGGKVNTPEMMRGIGSVAFQFKNYTANYLNLMYRSFANEGREGKMAGLAMLAGLMLVSGLRGIPFEGDLEQLLNWITETVTGINPNINMQLKEFARKGLMGAGLPEEQAILGASLMMNGLSRLTSVDLGSRFGQGDIVPNDVNSLFGPVVSAFSVAADGISHVKNGQTFQGTARLVPKAFGNVIESLGYTDQGIKTKAGNEVMGPNEFSTADQITKALGFQPSKLAERQELAYDLTRVSEQARKAAGGMARYLANMVVRAENARARGDMEAAEEAMQNYAERLRRYEREMSDPDRPAYMQYKINRDAIKKEIRNALDWRMRFLGGKKMARPEIIEILRRSGESIGA